MPFTYLADDMADDMAQDLFDSLVSGLPSVPTVDLTGLDYVFEEDNDSVLYETPEAISLETLTKVQIEGDGVFDKLMSAVDLHINREFKNNRLTGDQYATVYGGSIVAVLAQSVQFALGGDQAKWATIEAQMKARVAEIEATTARVNLEKAKFDAAASQFNMETSRATFALTKMEIANANAQHLLVMSQVEEQRYKVDNLLEITKDQQLYTLNTLMVDQHNLLAEQLESERSKTRDTYSTGGTIVGLAGKQRDLLTKQISLTQEQIESERSKTMDTRTDGSTVVVGQVGKQKDLIDEQIDSFIKDAKFKTAKLYFDGFITQYTINDLTDIPDELVKVEIDSVLASNRAYVGL